MHYLAVLVLTALGCVSAASEVCLTHNERESLKPQYLGRAMSEGDWKCAREIAELAQRKLIDCRSEFDAQNRAIQKELSSLKTAVDRTGPMSHISPAFQWAQSGKDIYVGVKFAHKLDAPMTSKKVDADNVTVTETTIYLNASDSEGNKKFYLEIPLFGEVVPENSTWSMGSVGRMTLILEKKRAPSKWPRLMSHRNKVPNMHFWFEIDERYADELEELKTEKEAGQPAKEDNVSDTAAVTNITEEESKEGEASGGRSNDQSAPITPEPVSPEVAALLAEKENVMKNLKASLAELDNETRKRKKEQDLLVRDAKAAIDKEIDQLKEGARKKADEKIAEIDATLGMTLNGKSSEL